MPMRKPWLLLLFAAIAAMPAAAATWPSGLPVYDHIVIVMEENKDFEQIIGNKDAPFINQLATDGALLTGMYGEEHHSEGNYFWLLSGSNQGVGFMDEIPAGRFTASNLGQQLIAMQRSFKGYSEDLPSIGSEVVLAPPGCGQSCLYARKHVPWISFVNIPNGTTADTSSNLRFADFPQDYAKLPTVSLVVPNQINDMHNGKAQPAIKAGDAWLRDRLQAYAQWAKDHQSLLVVTFDENDDTSGISGLTDPRSDDRVMKNRIPTIFYGAGIKPGQYPEGAGVTHVNILRTIEAMYGLPKSGGQQGNALQAGISDDYIITDVFVR